MSPHESWHFRAISPELPVVKGYRNQLVASIAPATTGANAMAQPAM